MKLQLIFGLSLLGIAFNSYNSEYSPLQRAGFLGLAASGGVGLYMIRNNIPNPKGRYLLFGSAILGLTTVGHIIGNNIRMADKVEQKKVAEVVACEQLLRDGKKVEVEVMIQKYRPVQKESKFLHTLKTVLLRGNGIPYISNQERADYLSEALQRFNKEIERV